MVRSRFLLLVAVTCVPILVPLPARAASPPTVSAATGTWPGWRGNPQHTGYQSLPGRIKEPAILWRFPLGGDSNSPVVPEGIKVIDANHDGLPDLIRAPAGSSRVSLHSLGTLPPRKLWDIEIPDYVSDPYTPSQVVTGRLRDGKTGIFIAGGRHQIALVVLDAQNGDIVSRRTFEFPGHMIEAGGQRQLVTVRKMRSGLRLVIISDYRSNQTYMFHGAISVNGNNLFDAATLNTEPYGLHYVEGSVNDFNDDGDEEILVSRFDPARKRHDLMILDAVTLKVRARFPDHYLRAIVRGSTGSWLILCQPGVHTETPPPFGTLAGYVLHHDRLSPPRFQIHDAAIPALQRHWDSSTAEDSAAAPPVIIHEPQRGSRILLQIDAEHDRVASELATMDLGDGHIVSRYIADAGVSLRVVEGPSAMSPDTPLIVRRNDGWSLLLSPLLKEETRIRDDNFTRNTTGNDHTSEVSAVADLGDGKPSVLVVDGASRLLRLDLSAAAPDRAPAATTLWASGTPQEILAVPSDRGSNLLVRRYVNETPTLALIDRNGTVRWEHRFAAGGADEVLPAGMNWGRGSSAGHPVIVASAGPPTSFPRHTVLLDAETGAVLWESQKGTFWDATFATADIDRDGTDDFISNYNTDKGSVISGKTGAVLAGPVTLPMYGQMGYVDYNGTPVVASVSDDAVDVLDAEDNAHFALLRYLRGAGKPPAIVWSIEQSSLEDERYSTPAVIPSGDSWMFATGSASGWLRARRGSDGSTLWKVHLRGGAITDTDEKIPLSSVVANDVDGDGVVDFVVGSADGWLYAIDSATGHLKWSLDLRGGCGSPIAADIDGDGRSEILVSAAGILYAIGPKPAPAE